MGTIWYPCRKRWCPVFIEQRLWEPCGVHIGGMGTSVFNVDGVEPYTDHAGRGGVQCPGAETVERYDTCAGRGRD